MSSKIVMGLLAVLAIQTGAPAIGDPSALHASGNKLVNASGQTVRLKGVNIPSMEWSNAGQNINGCLAAAMGSSWNAKLIRLPICQDRWWGVAPSDYTGPDNAAAYRAQIDYVVNTASAAGDYVLIDMHWSDEGVWGANLGQHDMPDNNTIPVWNDVANRYKNNPAVLFDAYNEPHDVSWNTWRNGGWVSEGPGYNTPGMQAIVNTIRNTGANNVIVVGGLDWAYDLTGIMNGYAISASNIMYAAHVYTWKTNWDQYVTVAAGTYPILIGEFGDNSSDNYTSWMPAILGWMDSHNYSGTAWSFNPSSTPCLINDETSFSPTYWFGSYVQPWLAQGNTTGGGTTGGGTTGGGGSTIANGNHTLTPQCATGSRLDANAAGTTNGTKVQIWAANGTNAQSWSFTNLSGSTYKIQPSYASTLCLDVNGASNANGTAVQIWSCNGSNAQQWTASATGSNYTLSPACAPGSVLDVSAAGTANGTQVDIWSANGTNAQAWSVN